MQQRSQEKPKEIFTENIPSHFPLFSVAHGVAQAVSKKRIDNVLGLASCYPTNYVSFFWSFRQYLRVIAVSCFIAKNE